MTNDYDDCSALAAVMETTFVPGTTVAVQINHLPDEILEFILSYLPPYKDLENCSLVSKRWQNIVKNLVRRSKLSLNKGLIDFHLQWRVLPLKPLNIMEPPLYQLSGSVANSTLPPAQPVIAGRFSHSALRINDFMYIFGGGSASDTTFNDLWRFNLSTMKWERPRSTCIGSYPSPKSSSSMLCWRNKLILFGGLRYPSLHPPYQRWSLFDELHVYDLDENFWLLIPPHSTWPPPTAGHSASIHKDCMVVFGGYQMEEGMNSITNETYCLDLNENRWWRPTIANNRKPPVRYNAIQVALDDDHLLVVGGCGGPNAVYSDAWVLDMTREVWSWRSIQVRNKKYAASHIWCNPSCQVNSKLVVLGPTPNMPQDFLMMKQVRLPMGAGGVGGNANAGLQGGGGGMRPAPQGEGLQNRNRGNAFNRAFFAEPVRLGRQGQLHPNEVINYNRMDNIRYGNGAGQGNGAINLNVGPNEQYIVNRRAIINQHMQNASSSLNSINNNLNINSLQPKHGRLSDLHSSSSTNNDQQNQNRPATAPSSSTVSSSSSLSLSSPLSSSAPSALANLAVKSNQGTLRANSSCSALSSLHQSDINSGAGSGGGAGVNNINCSPDLDAASRLQRNLALRSRENEPLLPKRFDELHEDPFRMAAFNVSRSSNSRDHNERIRRMEEKMNAIRNSRRNSTSSSSGNVASSNNGNATGGSQANLNNGNNLNGIGVNNSNNADSNKAKEPSPKRTKRNLLSLFVCELSAALNTKDPYIEWLEYKNYGIVPGAPERLILSTLIHGNGELVLFGGVQKETLGEVTHQVSNTIYFLSAPRDIV